MFLIKKTIAFSGAVMLAISLAACNEANDESADQESINEPSQETSEETDAGSPPEETEQVEPSNDAAADEKTAESTKNEEQAEVHDEQKQMALEVLDGVVKNAENGIVYRLSDGFKVGESSRDEVYAAIGEPEEQLDGFDFYHGSMGNASYQIAYDENDVMKEARYFGTNVERQTNLGGITRDDLLEHIGEPVEERDVPATGETNIIYHIADYELQFVMAEDGTTDHVNLLERQ